MSNRSKGVIVGLLITVALAPAVYAEPLLTTATRNPFQKVSAESCGSDRERLASWQFQGMVSGADYHSAWGRWPDASGQKLVVGQQLLPNWQVTDISAQQVTLQHINLDKRCGGFSAPMVLLMR
ncbi:pilus assembly protein PilP [Yersinia bercovieri]|uniref:pilus assembly protein PilP n=1 Tax=Yersinia bercovieri TaxID=634 RepID=UPI00005F75D9|nr:pilus assembly protein PilP [Yersinia bercovieri]QKJ06370.1 pilus assembly protein PilP [Yersinia bercovieri ATCC 43970]CFQ37620.1 type IV pilus biogenesis protein PilP [Yersinia bercovieri]